MADKLKKKLEAVSNMRSEIQVREHSSCGELTADILSSVLSDSSLLCQALESQVRTLQDENAVWESKYTELFRSHDLTSEPPAEPPVGPSVKPPVDDDDSVGCVM